MTFNYAQNDKITDAMEAYAAYRVYNDKVTTHRQNHTVTRLKDASFTLTLWELARNADLLIQKAGIGGMNVDVKHWAWCVKMNLEQGLYEHCNTDHIRDLLAEKV